VCVCVCLCVCVCVCVCVFVRVVWVFCVCVCTHWTQFIPCVFVTTNDEEPISRTVGSPAAALGARHRSCGACCHLNTLRFVSYFFTSCFCRGCSENWVVGLLCI
jgi:hypothetical protein